MALTINNENSTAVMRMLGQLNTWCLFCSTKLPTTVKHTMSPYHCHEIIWTLRRKNTRISNDFVKRFLRSSVSIAQTEKMRLTNACDARALIRSCTKGASRGYTGIRYSQNRNESDTGGLLRNSIRYVFISDWALSVVGRFTANSFADKLFNWKHPKLGPKTLRRAAKTISTFHNFSYENILVLVLVLVNW